jgi:hypothetical protein
MGFMVLADFGLVSSHSTTDQVWVFALFIQLLFSVHGNPDYTWTEVEEHNLI